MSEDISGRVMLVSLTVKVWGATKTDDDARDAAVQPFQASSDAGAFRKRLVSSESLADVKAAARAIRKHHARASLPWTDKGRRVLPTKEHAAYEAEMQKLKANFDVAVQAFMGDYQAHLTEAKQTLGGLFKAHEYPSQAGLADMFGCLWTFEPLASGSDFRLDLPQEEINRLATERDAQINAAVQTAQRDLYARLHKSLTDLIAGLDRIDAAQTDGKRVVTRDALSENVYIAGSDGLSLQITDDPILKGISTDAHDLGDLTPEEWQAVKTEPEARDQMRQKATDILTAMSGFKL